MKLLLILLLIIYYFSINIAHEIIQSDCHLQKRIVGHFSNAPNMKNITAKEVKIEILNLFKYAFIFKFDNLIAPRKSTRFKKLIFINNFSQF